MNLESIDHIPTHLKPASQSVIKYLLKDTENIIFISVNRLCLICQYCTAVLTSALESVLKKVQTVYRSGDVKDTSHIDNRMMMLNKHKQAR